MKILFLILATIILVGCDYYDDRLIINNTSKNTMYFSVSKDTILDLGGNETFMLESYKIQPLARRKILIPGSTRGWEFYAESSLENKLHIFLISEGVINQYRASEIVEYQMYEVRIDIGIQELQAQNWTVNF